MVKHRTRARQFHDKPQRKRSNTRAGRVLDKKRLNMAEPWERHAAGIRKRRWLVKGHLKRIPGSSRSIRVPAHYARHRIVRRHGRR